MKLEERVDQILSEANFAVRAKNVESKLRAGIWAVEGLLKDARKVPMFDRKLHDDLFYKIRVARETLEKVIEDIEGEVDTIEKHFGRR